MDNLDRQVLQQAITWKNEEQRVWLVTVVETWGSAPRPPGALLAMREDGLVVGSVSGGCVEDDLIDRVRQGERVDMPSVINYGVSREEAARFGLPCGGNLRLIQEPLLDTQWAESILEKTAAHQVVTRSLNIDTGESTIQAGDRHSTFQFDGSVMQSVFGPRWRVVVIGAGQLSRVFASIAQALDFEVICCDPRDEYSLTWDVADTTFSKEMPDDLILELNLDAHSAVVAVTHDPKLDDMAIMEALKSEAFYVGALGSRSNTAERKKRLAMFDLTDEQIDKLHGPIGLDIGSRTPAEIAVSIVAEIVAVRNQVAIKQKKPALIDAE